MESSVNSLRPGPSCSSGAGSAEAIRVLILEDNPSDAELMLDALRQGGYDLRWEVVDTEQRFTARLTPELDLILSDYALPQFSGLRALHVVRALGLDVPFILVSGSIGEEIAVDAMRSGADDYLLKDRMARLGPAVQRALEKRRLRREAALAEGAQRESEHRFHAAFEQAGVGMALRGIDSRNSRWLRVNQKLCDILGYTSEELSRLTSLDITPPEDRDVASGYNEKLVRGEIACYSREKRYVRKDGRIIWVNVSLTAVSNADGGRNHVISVIEDITERREADEKIRRLNRVLVLLSGVNSAIVRCRDRQELFEESCRIAVEHGNFGIAWIGTFDAERLELTPIASAGFEDDDPPARERLIVSEDAPHAAGMLGVAIRERRAVYGNDIAAEAQVGDRRWREAGRRGYRSAIVLPLLVSGAVFGSLSLFARPANFFDKEEAALLVELAGNISFALEHMAKQERIDKLSFYDDLTALPNRTLFLDRIGQQMRARSGETPAVALILLDLERFRNVNEMLGRRGGDEMMKLVAERLAHAAPGKDHLARVGPNLFGVLARGIRDPAVAVHLVDTQILQCFVEPFQLDGNEVRISAKGGIAMAPADGEDADTLLKNAEAALKRAKDSGERYLFYASEMNSKAAQILSLETRLRKAVGERQFVLHYQPKIELATGAIRGLEALIRWQEPEGSLVPPESFMPLLEETGLILEVGWWVIEQAFADHREWTARGLTAPRIAVNVSAVQLQQRDFADTVIEIAQRAGHNPDALELEVTETLLMRDVQASIRKLTLLRGIGIQIAMDDFGTGFSSLSYLARLPLNSLKIDRSFVSAMAHSGQDLAIVSTIIALARALGLKVVAEGVETEGQAQLLAALMCDEAQGFLYSKPLPAAEIEALLRAASRASRARRPQREGAPRAAAEAADAGMAGAMADAAGGAEGQRRDF